MRAGLARRAPAARLRFNRTTGLIALAAAVTALTSSWHAFALANRENRFPLVHKVAPQEPEALGRTGALVAAQIQKSGQRPDEVADMMRESLRGMALNSMALRLLAISKGAKLESQIDRRLVDLSAEISRRDLGTQAMRIILASRTNDLQSALSAYDIILRNRNGNPEQFYAPMAQAIAVPEMAPHFANYVREGAPWVPAFLTYAIPLSNQPDRIVDMIERGGGLDGYVDGPPVEVMLINRMLQTGNWQEAARFYATTKAYKPAVLSSPAISEQSLNPRENGLLWSLYQQDGPIAESVANKAIVVYADPGQKGEVGRKLLFLKPGQYRLSIAYEQLDLPEGSTVDWTGRCLSGTQARTIWSGTAKAADGAVRQNATLSVDGGCRVFDLALAIDASSSRTPASATVSGVSLSPINGLAGPQ